MKRSGAIGSQGFWGFLNSFFFPPSGGLSSPDHLLTAALSLGWGGTGDLAVQN